MFQRRAERNLEKRRCRLGTSPAQIVGRVSGTLAMHDPPLQFKNGLAPDIEVHVAGVVNGPKVSLQRR